MNTEQYLDMLTDYLKPHYNSLEINEIIRDIHEIILDSIKEGKSEDEILKGLGSPKEFAKEILNNDQNKEFKNNESFLTMIKCLIKNIAFKIKNHSFFNKTVTVNHKNAVSNKEIDEVQSKFSFLKLLGIIALIFLGIILGIPGGFVFIMTLAAVIFGIIGILLGINSILLTAVIMILTAVLISPLFINYVSYLDMNILYALIPLGEFFLLMIITIYLIAKLNVFIFKSIFLLFKNLYTKIKIKRLLKQGNKKDSDNMEESL